MGDYGDVVSLPLSLTANTSSISVVTDNTNASSSDASLSIALDINIPVQELIDMLVQMDDDSKGLHKLSAGGNLTYPVPNSLGRMGRSPSPQRPKPQPHAQLGAQAKQGGPSAQYHYFDVIFDRSQGEKLGIDVDYQDTDQRLRIDAIHKGIVQNWNKANPGARSVQVGDRIVMVDGVSADAMTLYTMCQEHKALQLRMERPIQIMKPNRAAQPGAGYPNQPSGQDASSQSSGIRRASWSPQRRQASPQRRQASPNRRNPQQMQHQGGPQQPSFGNQTFGKNQPFLDPRNAGPGKGGYMQPQGVDFSRGKGMPGYGGKGQWQEAQDVQWQQSQDGQWQQ